MTELLNLAKKGTITADMDGTIEEIYVSDEETSDSSSVSAGSGVQLSNMSYTKGTGIQALNMSYTKSYGVQASNMYYTNESVVRIVNVSDTDETAEIFSDDTGSMEEIPSQPEKQTLYLSMADTSAGNAQMLGIVVPRTGGSPQTQIVSSDNSYTGTISWNPGDSTFQPAATYQAAVTLYAGEGYQFAADSVTQAVSGVLSGVSLSSDGSTLSFTITFPETEGSTEEPGDTSVIPEARKEIKAALLLLKTPRTIRKIRDQIHRRARKMELQTEKVRCRQKLRIIIRERHRIQAVLRGQGVHPPEHRPQMASSQGKRKPRQIQPPSTAQTLQPLRFPGDTSMLLSVSVDELDINSVEQGQTAQVTFDAIEDKTFEGTVTKVGNTASASGGVAKYTVEITIPKDEKMKAGMNASATITIEEKENIVTIPVNALQERGEEVFVYTEQDDEGNLSGEQQVTTGLSDGENVEITEGLSEGDVVYYQKTGGGNTSSDTGFSMPGGDMGDMSGGGNMGNMPGVGDMGGGMGTPPGK